MVWAVTHLESLKDICKHQVQINQPLPPEVLKEPSFTEALNDTEVSPSGHTTTTSPATNPVHEYSPEFLAALEKISCLNECSGGGTCLNGRLNGKFKKGRGRQ